MEFKLKTILKKEFWEKQQQIKLVTNISKREKLAKQLGKFRKCKEEKHESMINKSLQHFRSNLADFELKKAKTGKPKSTQKNEDPIAFKISLGNSKFFHTNALEYYEEYKKRKFQIQENLHKRLFEKRSKSGSTKKAHFSETQNNIEKYSDLVAENYIKKAEKFSNLQRERETSFFQVKKNKKLKFEEMVKNRQEKSNEIFKLKMKMINQKVFENKRKSLFVGKQREELISQITERIETNNIKHQDCFQKKTESKNEQIEKHQEYIDTFYSKKKSIKEKENKSKIDSVNLLKAKISDVGIFGTKTKFLTKNLASILKDDKKIENVISLIKAKEGKSRILNEMANRYLSNREKLQEKKVIFN